MKLSSVFSCHYSPGLNGLRQALSLVWTIVTGRRFPGGVTWVGYLNTVGLPTNRKLFPYFEIPISLFWNTFPYWIVECSQLTSSEGA